MKCGRPTKSGARCKRDRMPSPSGTDYVSPACGSHASGDERADNARAHAADLERGRAFRRSLPVRCHEWGVTDVDLARAAAAMACADQDECHALATGLLDDWQDGRCAVCAQPGPLVTDHDHETARIRGLLCRFCNGKEAGDYEPGGRFDRYRARNPASILGLEVAYWNPFTGWALPQPGHAEGLDGSPGYRMQKILAVSGPAA